MKPNTLITLNQLLKDLKYEALISGRFPPIYTSKRYDIRHTLGKPFRCIAYNRYVRQINALSDAINELNKQNNKLNELELKYRE